MRNSILGSLQSRLEAVRRKESALRGTKKKGETGFTVESDLPTLKRTMKAQSRERMRRTVVSLVVLRMTMRDLDARDGKEKDPMWKDVKERGLIDQGNTETSLVVRNLGTASMMQR
jgi:hypothetical protein